MRDASQNTFRNVHCHQTKKCYAIFPSKADIGQEENFEEVEKKALKFGAKKVRTFFLFISLIFHFKYLEFFNILFETLLWVFVLYFLNHCFT